MKECHTHDPKKRRKTERTKWKENSNREYILVQPYIPTDIFTHNYTFDIALAAAVSVHDLARSV